jgi:hypothetical protein
VRIGFLERVYTLAVSVLRHGDTDNSFGSSIGHCYCLHFLADLGQGWAARRDSVAGAATTASVVEFKVLNLLAQTG